MSTAAKAPVATLPKAVVAPGANIISATGREKPTVRLLDSQKMMITESDVEMIFADRSNQDELLTIRNSANTTNDKMIFAGPMMVAAMDTVRHAPVGGATPEGGRAASDPGPEPSARPGPVPPPPPQQEHA